MTVQTNDLLVKIVELSHRMPHDEVICINADFLVGCLSVSLSKDEIRVQTIEQFQFSFCYI